MRRPPLRSTLFPDTTLFRSRPLAAHVALREPVELGVNEGRELLEGLLLAVAPRFQELGKFVSVIHQSAQEFTDRKSTRLNSSHANISYAVFCLKKKQSRHLV